MHALRLTRDKKSALAIYQATRKSPLYDKKLKMYKVTASLSQMPLEIGRCRVFYSRVAGKRIHLVAYGI